MDFLVKIIFHHKNLLKFLNKNKKRMYQLYLSRHLYYTYLCVPPSLSWAKFSQDCMSILNPDSCTVHIYFFPHGRNIFTPFHLRFHCLNVTCTQSFHLVLNEFIYMYTAMVQLYLPIIYIFNFLLLYYA